MCYNNLKELKMPLALLQAKLTSFPQEYYDEINNFFDLLSYKVNALSKNERSTDKKIIPGLAEGKWKYPKDINAFDDEIADDFKDYL